MKEDSSNRENEKKVLGEIASVRGSVVDLLFHEWIPPIHTLLWAGDGDGVPIEPRKYQR